MRKKTYLFIIGLLLSSIVFANNLVIYFYSGTVISIPVEEKPKIEFADKVVSINTEHFQFNDVKKYTFSDNEALGIEFSDEEFDNIEFIDENKLSVSLKDLKAKIAVFSTNGVEMHVLQIPRKKNEVVLDLNSLPDGVYIVYVGNENFKIRKR